MLKFKKNKKEVPGIDSLLVNFSSKSRYAEAYRTLRTNIYFSMMENELNSLVVTSSLQGEGKSNTVANLAYTIAQTGKTVLMVDGDLRKPGLTARFNVQKTMGVSNILVDVLGRHVNNGKITDYGLQDLITLHRLQKRTCIMTITNEKDKADLHFLKGELVDVYWANRPEGKKLASTLVQEKILTEDEARLALGHQKKSVRRLGSVLLALGLVDETVLNKILSVQVLEAFRVAMEMADASFVVNSSSENEIKLSVMGTINLSQLAQEFFNDEASHSFINENIDANVLEAGESNLYLLPAGNIPPNPSELLGSPITSYLLNNLKKKFDIIIVDTSPIIPATDALLLAPQVDGVVLVVKTGETDRKLIADASQQLHHAKANILGVLLNQADVSKGSYYKYYQSYYGD